MTVYRFCADSAVDVDRFYHTVMRQIPTSEIEERVVQPSACGPFDTHVEAEWQVAGLDRETLISVARSNPDFRTIAETLQPANRFTGRRWQH